MAGLREQVRQLEEVNEDMLEETTRYEHPLLDSMSCALIPV